MGWAEPGTPQQCPPCHELLFGHVFSAALKWDSASAVFSNPTAASLRDLKLQATGLADEGITLFHLRAVCHCISPPFTRQKTLWIMNLPILWVQRSIIL